MAATYDRPGVYIEEQRSGSIPIQGVGTSTPAFIGFTQKYVPDPDDPTDPDGVKPHLVTNWEQYERMFGRWADGAMLPFAVKGFFENGGTSCVVVRIPHQRAGEARPASALLPPANGAAIAGGLRVEAVEPGVELAVELLPPPAPEEGQEQSQEHTLRVLQDGTVREEVPGLDLAKGARAFEKAVKEKSRTVTITVEAAQGTALTDLVPPPGPHPLRPAPVDMAAVQVTPAQVEGSETERTGYQGLAIMQDVTMVAVPDLVNIARGDDGVVDEERYLTVQQKLVDFCEASGRRMAILDTPPGLNASRALDWRVRLQRDTAFATLYYPNLIVDNPTAEPDASYADRYRTVPPVGHLAGIWARTDAQRGVWKAPANEPVRGIKQLANEVTDGEQALLNPKGVNCIRSFGVNGVLVWGARTLAMKDQSWRYINVRRLFNFVEESIRQGTQWAVFEPNNQALWELVKRNITSFLRGLADQGAFATAAGSPGFYVKCDAANNPPESIDEGKLIVEVGIAPVKPAEFVIFRISQLPSGGTVTE